MNTIMIMFNIIIIIINFAQAENLLQSVPFFYNYKVNHNSFTEDRKQNTIHCSSNYTLHVCVECWDTRKEKHEINPFPKTSLPDTTITCPTTLPISQTNNTDTDTHTHTHTQLHILFHSMGCSTSSKFGARLN